MHKPQQPERQSSSCSLPQPSCVSSMKQHAISSSYSSIRGAAWIVQEGSSPLAHQVTPWLCQRSEGGQPPQTMFGT